MDIQALRIAAYQHGVPFQVTGLALIADQNVNASPTVRNEIAEELLPLWLNDIETMIVNGEGATEAAAWFKARGVTW